MKEEKERGPEPIEVWGAGENNLKQASVKIPKNQVVVFTGVSVSGKSSLVFDTLAVESNREWQNNYSLYIRNKMPHYERPKVDRIENLTPVVVVDQKMLGKGNRSTVGTAIDISPLLRLLFSRVGKPTAGSAMAFSSHHPSGTCPVCTGLKEQMTVQEETLFDTEKSLREGAILFSQFSSGWQHVLYLSHPKLDPDKKLKDYTKEEWKRLVYGEGKNPKISLPSNGSGHVNEVDYEGVVPRFYRLYVHRDISKLKESLQQEIMTHLSKTLCPACQGTGLNPKALACKIKEHNIVDFLSLAAEDLLPILQTIDDPVGRSISHQIVGVLEKMCEVGIGYLSLDRPVETLSGGEAQRIKLVRSLGSSLNNITYLFDEPTAGLHPYDAEKIGRILVDIRNHHNNVLVVEHNRQIIELADYVVELGPGAGREGGTIVFEGNPKELKETKTETEKMIGNPVVLNPSPRPWKEGFLIEDANLYNLKHLSVRIPKGILTAVTGVAGSGKTTLITKEFASRFPEVILIDQKPIGTSIRSTPATYTGIMDDIRKIFSKANHVSESWFTFNGKGACPICHGKGVIRYDMAFADSVEVVCEECGGHRYNEKARGYLYKGKNIEQVLSLTVSEATLFFPEEKIKSKLKLLKQVGLGYLSLGQPTGTLSGGELQRIKLSAELSQKGKIVVFDEPSTGLHNKDIVLLKKLFTDLVENGNTVVIIEHRPELISFCDWIIDLGPGGGTKGGEIIFEGTPQEIVKERRSKTGYFLQKYAGIQ